MSIDTAKLREKFPKEHGHAGYHALCDEIDRLRRDILRMRDELRLVDEEGPIVPNWAAIVDVLSDTRHYEEYR